MKRKILNDLIEWKHSGTVQAYMLIGARQVGKTYILEQFCKEHFDNYIYINLEKNKEVANIFEQSLDPDEIMHRLSLIEGKTIDPEQTVIFIDEIQTSERAITSLKYFSEAKEHYHVVTAGSLLGVALNRFKSSFPVGKVKRSYLYPMDFEEFLWATGNEGFADEIHKCLDERIPMFEAGHSKLMRMYRDYLFVGGMPASILEYLRVNKDLNKYSNEIKRNILDDYLADMSKYTTATESVKIKKVFESVPFHLGHESSKFTYRVVEKGANKQKFSSSIDWLTWSQLVYRAYMLEHPRIPFKGYRKENIFKVYMGDVGLLTELAEMTPYDLESEGASLYTGMLTESYAAQCLAASGSSLYFWKSGNIAEIDFVVKSKGLVVPLEVKASTNTKSKALKSYQDKYNPSYAIKISAKNFGFSDKIWSIPLYALPMLAESFD